MAARLWVTSLMRSRGTAAQVAGQHQGVSPREVAGGRARSKNTPWSFPRVAGCPYRLRRLKLPRSTMRFFPALQAAFTGRLPDYEGLHERTIKLGYQRLGWVLGLLRHRPGRRGAKGRIVGQAASL